MTEFTVRRYRRAEFVLLLLTALTAGLLVFARTYHVEMWLDDIGTLFDAPYRILSGEIPYRDFDLNLTPLTFYTHAAGLKLFGYSYLFNRIYASTQCALLVVMTFLFCRRVLARNLTDSVLLAAFQTIWAPQMMLGSMWYDGDVTLAAFSSGLCLYAAWTRAEKSVWWNAACGVLCALAFWYKQDIGAGALACGLTLGWLRAARGGQQERRDALALSAGAILVFLAALLYFGAHGALSSLYYWVVRRALEVKWGPDSGGGPTSCKLLSPFTTPVDRSSKFIVLIYLATTVSAWWRYRRSGERRELALAAASLLWFGSFYAGLFTHNGQGYSARMATLGAVLGMLGRPWDWGILKRFERAAYLSWLILVALLAFQGLRYHRNLAAKANTERIQNPMLAGMAVFDRAHTLDRLAQYIKSHVPPEDDFLDFDSIVVYYLTLRRHPHPFINCSGAEVNAGDEPRLMAQLERSRLQWYFHFGNRRDFERNKLMGLTGLKAYLVKNFNFKESRDGFTVWQRKR